MNDTQRRTARVKEIHDEVRDYRNALADIGKLAKHFQWGGGKTSQSFKGFKSIHERATRALN